VFFYCFKPRNPAFTPVEIEIEKLFSAENKLIIVIQEKCGFDDLH
jgi:hypothetical protein